MSHEQDPVALARELLDAQGLDGVVEVSRRAEACRQAGDRQGVLHWNAVARSMRLIATAACQSATCVDAPADPIADSALWRLMQRIEHFRHRARICEQQAASASSEARRELLEMAHGWLELAAYAEMLAHARPPAEV